MPRILRIHVLYFCISWNFWGDTYLLRSWPRGLLTKYAGYNLHTLYRYTHMIKGFMKWYGEPLVDVNIKVPKTLPLYTEDVDIEKLLDAVVAKKTHKRVIASDKLQRQPGWFQAT
jgi:hypothetical protein